MTAEVGRAGTRSFHSVHGVEPEEIELGTQAGPGRRGSPAMLDLLMILNPRLAGGSLGPRRVDG